VPLNEVKDGRVSFLHENLESLVKILVKHEQLIHNVEDLRSFTQLPIKLVLVQILEKLLCQMFVVDRMVRQLGEQIRVSGELLASH